jgi:alpha-D-ribose 1-methylphosphonate 5-triphosphate diphosphatase PhnM
MPLRRFGILIILSIFALGLLHDEVNAGRPKRLRQQVIAFLHVTVIPMDCERTLSNHTVTVVDGKITSLGPSSKVKVPAGALRIDGIGRYLIPALCDMHVHMLGEPWNLMLLPEAKIKSNDIPYEKLLFPFVANGVTTVQELFASREHIDLRQRIA